VPIRTPDQRLRIFVSSTLAELAEERRAVREAIEGLRLTPVMFELGARPHPPRMLYRAYLEQSDVFIGVYWERYGWTAADESISGLEDEYLLSGDRPKLVYLKMPAPGREPRLEELLDRVRADDRVSYRSFETVDELRALVADDLAVLITERFVAGRSEQEPDAVQRAAPIRRPLTTLVGREEEIDELVRRLAAPEEGRLVTLVGPGGIGKTRLALAVAQRLEDGEHFPDGVAFVDLSAVSEPALMLTTIAQEVGVRDSAGASLGIALRDAMRERHMLLVLDNRRRHRRSARSPGPLLPCSPSSRETPSTWRSASTKPTPS
jgi:hypothetical protein